ncbi:hypothetical protein MTR_7g033950 [Medicago truncatula]|uniref:Uncharacterized protein n=1 Tax=Medicago truncatula TaxID=3880 RepID=A0A072TXE7_MEDTR|nr:hypothetical protein MTR_7g033950 [Medicago truncatula]
MDQHIFHRSWMYDRKYPGKRKLKAAFVDGVRDFVAYAMAQDAFQLEGGIRCPFSQVYYVPYPSHHRRKHGWCAAIKCKPRGQFETEVPDKEIPYQDDEILHVPDVIEVDPITNLVDRDVDGQQLDAETLA